MQEDFLTEVTTPPFSSKFFAAMLHLVKRCEPTLPTLVVRDLIERFLLLPCMPCDVASGH